MYLGCRGVIILTYMHEKNVSVVNVNNMANMNLCNEKQKSALKTTKEGHNVLIKGQFGTEASFLLRYW